MKQTNTRPMDVMEHLRSSLFINLTLPLLVIIICFKPQRLVFPADPAPELFNADSRSSACFSSVSQLNNLAQ